MAAILQETSVDRFLGTNYSPNDVEIEEIQQCISGPLQRLEAIEDEIVMHEMHLDRLYEEGVKIQASIARHQALLSPIRHLPVDLLREIFVACLPVNHISSMGSAEAPVLLTRISSHWRNIALTTPRLWAAIHIPIPQLEVMSTQSIGVSEQQEVTRRRCVGVNEFLSRSGSLPLTISIRFTKWGVNQSYERTSALFDCIVPFAARWQDITIVGPASAFSQVRELRSEFPLLRALRLDITNDGINNEPVFSWKESRLFKAEGLLRFSTTSLNENIIDLPVRWSQLTELVLTGDDWITNDMFRLKCRDAHQILRMSPALISCELHVLDASMDLNATFSPVALIHLETLSIKEPLQCPKFLASFNVPSLKTLEYFPNSPCTSGLSSLLVLLSNLPKGNRLEKLITTPHFFDSGEFIDILRHCGNLRLLSLGIFDEIPSYDIGYRDLDVENSPINDVLLRLLTPREEPHRISDIDMPGVVDLTDQLCPKLEELSIFTKSNVSEDALLTFISKKQSTSNEHTNKSRKLKNIHVYFHRPKAHDITPNLSAFIASGLKVRIQYSPRMDKSRYSLYDGLPRDRILGYMT